MEKGMCASSAQRRGMTGRLLSPPLPLDSSFQSTTLINPHLTVSPRRSQKVRASPPFRAAQRKERSFLFWTEQHQPHDVF